MKPASLVEDYHRHYWRLINGAHVRSCAWSDCLTAVVIVGVPGRGYRWTHCHSDDPRHTEVRGEIWSTWQDAAQDAIESGVAHPTNFGGGIG